METFEEVMGENIFIEKDCAKPLNLNVGKCLKRFIELSGKMVGKRKGEVVVDILRGYFPKCHDDKWHEWIKAAAKADGRNVTGWVKFSFPEKVPVKSEFFHKLPVEERAELFHLMLKFSRTTFWYNAVQYIKGDKPADMGWTDEVRVALDELRDYYVAEVAAKTEKCFNPLK